MSFISSLLLFLLCVSFRSCYGRHLGAIGKEPETESLLPFKNDETTSREAGNGEGMVNQMSMLNKKEDHKPLKAKEKTSPGAVKTDQSLPSTVSWRVPYKKRGEEQPGFNLDYDYPLPRAHPPSHN